MLNENLPNKIQTNEGSSIENSQEVEDDDERAIICNVQNLLRDWAGSRMMMSSKSLQAINVGTKAGAIMDNKTEIK